MFDHYSPIIQEQTKLKRKAIILMQNGHPQRTFTLQINSKKPLNKQQIFKAAEKAWVQRTNTQNLQHSQSNQITLNSLDNNQNTSFNNFTSKSMRIFSIEAVEYFDQDLQYLKNGDRLYISRGEEFDSNKNFGQYEIIKKLGEGGFGSVNLAKNIITKQYAAIKIVKPDKNSNSSDIDMIFKEAENLKALNHPNIVKILNCYTLNDMRVVIVMQYLEGGELLELLKQQQNGYFQEKQAKYYFKQIISGVSYCHRQGIIHRDLKLQNILIKNVKQNVLDKKQKNNIILKIADFGISGVANKFNPEVDWGTLRYMPPEVLSGKTKSNSQHADIWALGIILYLLVTGKFPFDGGSSAQIMDSIIKKQFQFPKNILLTIKCKNLIKLLLQKNPTDRITLSDIEHHQWINQNITIIPGEQTSRSPILNKNVNLNIKTVGSQQHFFCFEGKERIFQEYQEYDIEDIKKIKSGDILKQKEKNKERRIHELKQIRDYRQKNNLNSIQRRSINGQKNVQNGPLKIPKRLEKQKDQIIEQLKSYKEFKEQKDHKQKDDKEKKRTLIIPNKSNSNLEEKQKQRQRQKNIFPIINNRRPNKAGTFMSQNSNMRKQKHSVMELVGAAHNQLNNEIKNYLNQELKETQY